MTKIEAQVAKGALRLTATHQGAECQRLFYRHSLIVGRHNGSSQPDFDLSGDNTISRSHARIWVEEGSCWIEDLGSKFGTQVDGADIRGRGKVRVEAASRVQIGNTALKVEGPLGGVNAFAELPASAPVSTIEIDTVTNNSPGRLLLPKSTSLDAAQTQALLLEILVQFSIPAPLDQLLRTITSRVVDLIPGAKRAALVLRNPDTDGLFLAAFVSACEPAVSETLARRALKEQQAFVWRNNFGVDGAISIYRHQIQSGMYAPLIYDGCPLGVLCVDNPDSDSAFAEQDLQLLVAVADHAAVAVSHHQLREKLKAGQASQEHSSARFPSGVNDRPASEAPMHPEPKKSEVALLSAELRGIRPDTEVSDLVETLNDYSAALIEPILKFGGRLERFMGDAILAVFNASEPTDEQCAQAVKAAWSMQQAIEEINRRRTADQRSTCQLAIGLHCGPSIHGWIGSPQHGAFAVIGDLVRDVPRYARAAAAGEILLSAEMSARVSSFVDAQKTARSLEAETDVIAFRLTKVISKT